MLDIKFIRDHPEEVKKGISLKGTDPVLVDQLLDTDKTRRELLVKSETLRAARNKLNRDQIEEGKKIKGELKEAEAQLDKYQQDFDRQIHLIPNLPSPLAPVGKNDTENVEIRRWGDPRKFDFPVKDHLELGKTLGILDFDTGAKVSGSQFYFLYNEGALLELALIRFAFDQLMPEGFTPVITPDLAKSRYYLGTGYAPKGDEAQTYTIEDEDLGLIATAEVTLAGKHADEIIPAANLPIKYIGYSHCFRKEAGAYGKYSKGMYRVHQFTKAEMFIYCLPEESEQYHQLILSMEEKICQALGLPYRVLEMCTGDLGAMAVRKFDVEAWMPGRNDYGEITSTSNCTDYQARNLNIRFRRPGSETEFLHMLNGTAVVTSRIPIAILENNQNPDGSVTIPEALRPYMGTDVILPKK
ncbi:serine--tRNA ligase [Candidatus Amesbacteria bacterium RIFCSPLOWO2_01_FULL_47_33]|uniref:Serine--tRNA ligase n=1 Tax=Candidatus Amesbacteria bacterium RIFCSPLOWO2_01_FULL_47_33 TaxID=1797258 RepID=A0A1F4Z007_9BACT|nr:MAG: serine--tRNA ligase [Candidatus Amesbacteria bacterium RIFCSPLOWO2_01_FULL_47_33]